MFILGLFHIWRDFVPYQQNRECKLLVFLLTGIGLSLTLHPNFPLVTCTLTRKEILFDHHVTLSNLQMTYRFFKMAIYPCKSSSKNSFSL